MHVSGRRGHQAEDGQARLEDHRHKGRRQGITATTGRVGFTKAERFAQEELDRDAYRDRALTLLWNVCGT